MFFSDGTELPDTRQQVLQLLVSVWDSKWATLYGGNQLSARIIHRDRYHLLERHARRHGTVGTCILGGGWAGSLSVLHYSELRVVRDRK